MTYGSTSVVLQPKVSLFDFQIRFIKSFIKYLFTVKLASQNKLGMDFLFNPYFYYLTIALQIICVFHCLKNGNEQKWIWLIVFMPMVGCIVYFFSEIVNKNNVATMQQGLGTFINPTGSIKKLEKELKFSNTFQNKVALADAYFLANRIDEAVALYESCLTGTFTENEHVNIQLIHCYFKQKRYSDIISKAKIVYHIPQFQNSKAHIIFAQTLAAISEVNLAENEFKKMNAKFANYESRYQYSLFLVDQNRREEAKQLLQEMLNEKKHLSSYEKRASKQWLNLANDQLKKM